VSRRRRPGPELRIARWNPRLLGLEVNETFGVYVDGPVQVVADVPLGSFGLLVEASEAVPTALVVPGEGGVELCWYPG